MCNQYEAHEVYFYYACVKYDVISYMTSSCRDEWNRLLLLQNTLTQGNTKLKIPISFHIYIHQVSF